MADGICHCRVVAGRCYSQLADGIALVNYCSFSSEMLNRTSSQICGRWYLPMFLLRDGSLTLIYRASLMVLVRFWSSLPTMSNFNTNFVTSGVIVVKYGGWGLWKPQENMPKIWSASILQMR